jgi:large conductance mechanosensitive channel
MKNFFEEFKKFALKGNVMDLAVGVIIGTAFGKIVSALVENIITPLIGIMLGGKNFDALSITFYKARISYGIFLSAVIDFLIVALVLFVVVRLMNRLIKKRDSSKKSTDKPADIKLLEEIRDLLKNK